MTHLATAITRGLRSAVPAALALALALGSVAYAPKQAMAAYPSFTFSGSGFGHGIGLSQYGAKGFAEHGKTGQWIATYYYPGTKIGAAEDRQRDVNIDKGKTKDNSGFARASWAIRPGYTSSTLDLYAGGSFKTTLKEADGPYTFSASGASVVVRNGSNATVGTYTGVVEIVPKDAPTGQPQLTQVLSASGPFGHTYIRYRGKLRFSAQGGLTKCVNRLWMQEYLYGVVPRESPSSWHIEALKAQAIVARSYSWGTTGELYCTTMSQVYNGHSRGDRGAPTMHEATSSNQAVDATANQFVTYNGAVITTYFSSSSGGHTANIEDVWLTTGQPSTTYPYRKGVDDPYCQSPYDPWPDPLKIDGLALAKKLAAKTTDEPAGTGTSVYVKSLVLDRAFPSGFVRRADVRWSNGAVSKGLSGDAVRNALGLRSTKFYVNGAYTRVAYGDRYDTSAKISEKTFATAGSAPAAVVVNGTDAKFADALTASALAGAAGGPVLMVPGDRVPSSVKAELGRLKALGCSKVYIVGGTRSVTAAVATTIAGIIPATERLAGNDRYGYDRYGTAATVALEMRALGASGASVLVASGEKWPDAAIAAGIAAGTKRPVVLTASKALPSASKRVLADLGSTQSVVFGGTKSITDTALRSILAETGEAAPAKRFGTTGSRYDVAVQAAKWAVADLGYGISTVYIASGETFPDAVTGGVVSGHDKRPLLLTNSNNPTPATAAYIYANRGSITGVKVFGGPASVSDYTASTLASYSY